MSYDYAIQRPLLFTEEGQRGFLAIRDHVHKLLKASGAVRMEEAMSVRGGPSSSWTMLACVDRMVELGELREVPQPGCAGQFRVFVAALQWSDE